jgi:hypothetical protein
MQGMENMLATWTENHVKRNSTLNLKGKRKFIQSPSKVHKATYSNKNIIIIIQLGARLLQIMYADYWTSSA